MADLRVLKLALLAETKDFISGLDKAQKNTKSFNQKIGKALKTSALAFAALGAAAGAAAIKIGKDAVAAAIEDEQSQVQLATALRNSTNATDAQIKATEKYITKAQNATGVTDTQLRAALGNLTRATGDVTKAQELNNLALDISAATGKDLGTISEALSKAYQGQTGALTRLDPSITAVIKSGADADEIFKALSETFGGAAAENAETFAGKMEIIKRRVEDAQETIGYALLPILERLSSFVAEKVVPAFEGLVRGLTGGPRSVRGATKETNSAFADMGIVIDENDSAAYELGAALRDLASRMNELFFAAEDGTGKESGLIRFLELITRIVDAIDRFIGRIDAFKTKIAEFNDAFNRSSIGQFVNATGQFAPENAPLQQGRERSGGVTVGGARAPQINVNVSGAIDPQGVARTVKKVFDTARATTGLRITAPTGFF